MRKITAGIAGLALLLLYSFSDNPAPVKFTIDAEIKGMKDDTILLMVRNLEAGSKKVANIDTFTTYSKNGKFILSGTTPEVVNANVRIGKKGRNNFNIFLENGKAFVRGNIDSLEEVRISGTPENDLYTLGSQCTQKHYSRINVLYTELKTLKDNPARAKEIDSNVAQLRDSVQQCWVDFVTAHPNSLTSGIYLYVLQDRTDVATLERLYNGVGDRIKNGMYGPGVKDKIAARKRTAIGNAAIDFAAVDIDGKKIALKDYKGKYLLLDFWASWCVPCRAENPALKTAYQKFKDKGFAIVSVSLDSDAGNWKKAIEQDGLPWIHTSEANGFDNPIAKAYGVQPIPDNFLISPDGKIVARALRGDELESTLSKYIK